MSAAHVKACLSSSIACARQTALSMSAVTSRCRHSVAAFATLKPYAPKQNVAPPHSAGITPPRKRRRTAVSIDCDFPGRLRWAGWWVGAGRRRTPGAKRYPDTSTSTVLPTAVGSVENDTRVQAQCRRAPTVGTDGGTDTTRGVSLPISPYISLCILSYPANGLHEIS